MIIIGKYIFKNAQENLNTNKSSTEYDAIYVRNGFIEEIGACDVLKKKYPEDDIIGDKTKMIMPGFVDAHTHGAGLSFIQRGVKYDFLENSLFDFEGALDIEPEANSMLNAVRHIKNGCTTIHHNNWAPPNDVNEIEACEKKINAYQKTGIRLGFSLGTRIKNILAYDDKNFINTLPEQLQRQVAPLVDIDQEAAIHNYFDTFEHLYRKYNEKTTRIFFGPSWVQGATDFFLQKIKERADELGKIPIHIHTLQTPVQKAFGLRTYNKSLLQHLDDIGLVDQNVVLGHAVFLNRKDIEIVAKSHASITHHPSCNLVMRNGIAPVYSMLNAGVNVAMGIDEKGINDDEDAIMEMKMIYLLHRISRFNLSKTPALTAYDVIKICTENGSRVCGHSDEIGTIAVGKKADIILIDLKEILNEPWVFPGLEIPEIFVHRALGRHVKSVIIDGKVVMKDREIKTVDVELLYKEVIEQAKQGKSIDKVKYEALMKKIKPYYQEWYNKWLDNLEIEPFYLMNSKI